MEGLIRIFVITKPWLGSLSFQHFPFRDWQNAPPEQQLVTSISGYFDLAVALISVVYLYRHRAALSRLPARRTWIIFLLFLLVSAVLISPSTTFALRRWVKILVFACLYAVGFVLARANTSNALSYVRSLATAAWIPILYGTASFLSRADLTWTAIANRDYREYSTFLHANPYAYFCVLALLACSVIWKYNRLHHKPTSWRTRALAVLLPLALLTTGARAAVIGAIFSYVLAVRGRVIRKVALAALGMAVLWHLPTFANPVRELSSLVFGTEVSASDQLTDVASEISRDEVEHTSEISTRLLIWATMLDQLDGHYLVGRGLGSSALSYEEVTGTFLNAHNDYIGLTFEIGLSGLFLYGFTLTLVAARLGTVRKMTEAGSLQVLLADAALFCVIYLAVISLTDNLFVDDYNSPLIWGLLGTSAGVGEPPYDT